jgi:hypothetical protein
LDNKGKTTPVSHTKIVLRSKWWCLLAKPVTLGSNAEEQRHHKVWNWKWDSTWQSCTLLERL